MSDAKKSGSRDISELKQRLGLKKAAPSGQTSSVRSNGASGGVVPPPGLTVTAPPGMAPPPSAAPPQPPPPSVAEDPFGAMNALAAQASVQRVQRAPDIVVVNDGAPVEHVGQKSFASTLLRMGIPAVAALIVGLAIGKIGSGAAVYNDGLRGSKAILGDKSTPSTVAFLKHTLSDLDNALDDKSKTGFHPDADLDKKLKDIAAKLDVKSEAVFRANWTNFDTEGGAQALSFYAGIAEVKDMIDQHVKASLADDMALKKGKDAADANDAANVNGNFKYGVLVQAPTEQDKGDAFGAKLVILAGAYCGGASPVAQCPGGEQPSAYAYVNDPGAAPTKGDLVSTGADTVPTRKVLPLLQNGVRDSLIKGSDPTVAEVYYQRRLRAIYERVHGKNAGDKSVGGLLEDGNKLESRLQAEANKGSRFSFFM